MTAEEVTDYLQENDEFTKDYFLKHATPKLVETWVMRRSHRLSVPNVQPILGRMSRSCMDLSIAPCVSVKTTRRKSIDTEASEIEEVVTKKRKTADELATLNEKDLFMELIRDIAYELDIDVVSHKILVNVCILTNCDRSSLFLCQGHKDRQYLVSRLFDVTRESSVEEAVKPIEEAIRIPFGVGIAGAAAATGKIINIKDAYQDPRFNRKIDDDTGYRTCSILCMPVKNADGEVIGVAQIINKREEVQEFTNADEETFSNYLTFCGIGLTNARLFEQSVQDYTRNQVLLNLAKNIFEDTECLETVVRRIMTQSVDIMNCERCTVYIINRDVSNEELHSEDIIFSNVFDFIRDSQEQSVKDDYYQDLAQKSTEDRNVYSGFAMLVAQTGEILNVDSFTKESVLSTEGNDFATDKFRAKSMLCCPIYNNRQDVIGVAQLFNKLGGRTFDENDEIMLEGFTTYCGLGIHNTQNFEKAAIMLARQKVNLEVLQYHASPGEVYVEEFLMEDIPLSSDYDLFSFTFDDVQMTEHETCLLSMGMFLENDLLKKFRVPDKTMAKFILSVKNNYREVIYHNWRHAFNVAQTMFAIFHSGQMESWFTDLEIFVLLIACLSHDLDHRGTNNNFQVLSESPIARLYGTSTMERHHFDHCVMLLQSEGSDIFGALNEEEYQNAMAMLEEAILSTDLALFFKKKGQFQDVVEKELADWSNIDNRDVLRAMLMTACDVAAITKPWPIQQRVAELVASEFFQQGDLERSNFSKEPMAMMDRQKHSELPKMQVGFIDFVCMLLYKTFYHINPHLKPLYDGVVNNRKNWQEMIDQYEPDKVVIQKPPLEKRRESSISYSNRKTSRNVSFAANSHESKFCNML